MRIIWEWEGLDIDIETMFMNLIIINISSFMHLDKPGSKAWIDSSVFAASNDKKSSKDQIKSWEEDKNAADGEIIELWPIQNNNKYEKQKPVQGVITNYFGLFFIRPYNQTKNG